MAKVSTIKNSQVVNEIESYFSYKDRILDFNASNILGNNVKLNKAYNKGQLDTLIYGSIQCNDRVTNLLGHKCVKPFPVVFLANSFPSISKDGVDLYVQYVGVKYFGNDIILEVNYDYDYFYTFRFRERNGALVLVSDDSYSAQNGFSIKGLESRITRVIEWASSITPVLLFSIEYYMTRENSGHVGRSSTYYVGLAEARYCNGVSGLSSDKDDVRGEYVMGFIEVQ